VHITYEFHEFCWFTISGTSDDGKASYGPKFKHILIMTKTRGSHRQYDMRGRRGTKPRPSRAKVLPAGPTPLVGRPRFGIFSKSAFNACQLKSTRRVSNVGKAVPTKKPPNQVKWPTGLTCGPPKPKLRPRNRHNPPINTLLLLPAEGVKKVSFSPL
jgi:hypothetical protein